MRIYGAALTFVFISVAFACGSSSDDTAMVGSGTDGGADGTMIGTEGGASQDGQAADGAPETCLGSTFLQSLGKTRLLVGGSMDDATADAVPFDVRYQYISGGISDGAGPCAVCTPGCTSSAVSCKNPPNPNPTKIPGCGWWGCFQYDLDPPGKFVSGFASAATPRNEIPMFTYYEILQASNVVEGKPEVTVANDSAFMPRYFADYRFFLQQIGQSVALIHIEPDFWGYAESVNEDPHLIPAAVASANATDCASEENTIAGLGRCFVSMARKYAPKAKISLHASAWGTQMDVMANKNAAFDVTAEAQKLGAFLMKAGAATGDFIAVDPSDRDAGYYATQARDTYWDATNATLPNFHQAFAWAKALAESLGLPIVWWQIPLGNAAQNDTVNHWKDNRVDYFFSHVDEVAQAHSVGMFFGAGRGDQTLPESDGGNFIAKSKAFFAGPPPALCP